jgi:hypothetical protein
MPSSRMKQRRVVHKSTAGILTTIPEAVDLVGNSPPGLTNNTQSLRSSNESLLTGGPVGFSVFRSLERVRFGPRPTLGATRHQGLFRRGSYRR